MNARQNIGFFLQRATVMLPTRNTSRLAILGLCFLISSGCGDAADLENSQTEHALGDVSGVADANPDASVEDDGGTLDSTGGSLEDVRIDTGGAVEEDAGVEDSGLADTATSPDIAAEDAGAPDTGPVDTGPTTCNDGTLNTWETCDLDCPANCDDGLLYTTDLQSGSADECTISCAHADSGLD
ncbi:MAG: hypothetical protein ACI9OJ_003558, partial [Myxococcota bacterium]